MGAWWHGALPRLTVQVELKMPPGRARLRSAVSREAEAPKMSFADCKKEGTHCKVGIANAL